MKHIDEMRCRQTLEDLAALWPDAQVPPALAARLSSCPACWQERASFEALCAKSSSWSETLPKARWRALALATNRALPAKRTIARTIVWAPALAFAAASLAVLFTYRVPDVAVPRLRAAVALPPKEVLDNQELLESLQLLQDWDAAKAASGARL